MSNVKERITDEMKKKWDDRIKLCQEHRELLDDWERDLIFSLEEQRYWGKILSPRQVKYLYIAYDKVNEELG